MTSSCLLLCYFLFLSKIFLFYSEYYVFFNLTLPSSPFLLMYPEQSTTLAMVRVEPRCGDRLAVCALHIACSQRLGSSEQNNNHKSGLSAERQGLFSGWHPAIHQGYAAVIRREEVLEIPNSEDGGRRGNVTRYKGRGVNFLFCMLASDLGRQSAGTWSVDSTQPQDEKGTDERTFKVFKSVYCSFPAFRTTTRAYLDIRQGV